MPGGNVNFSNILGDVMEEEFRNIVDRNNYIPSASFKDTLDEIMFEHKDNLNINFIENSLREVRQDRARDIVPPLEMIAAVYDRLFYILIESNSAYPSIQGITEYLNTFCALPHGRNMVPLIAASYVAHYEMPGRPHAYIEMVELLQNNHFNIDNNFIRNCNLPEDAQQNLQPGRRPSSFNSEDLVRRRIREGDGPER